MNTYRMNDIHETLLQVGIPANLLGFTYLACAIQLIMDDSTELQNVTRRLYVDVANQYHTTPSRVERAIRHAIHTAWNQGDLDYLEVLFKNSVNPLKGSPTNSQFIARLYFYFLHK